MRVRVSLIGVAAGSVALLVGCSSTSGLPAPRTSSVIAATTGSAASTGVALSTDSAAGSAAATNVSGSFGAATESAGSTSAEQSAAPSHFDSLKTGLGNVAGAAAYLAETEQGWRGTIAGLSSDAAAVAADARCYFVLDPSQTFTSAIACGPIRRTESADGHVWDLYNAQVQASMMDNGLQGTAESMVATPALASASAGDTGSARPPGTLYRPDGQEAAAAADALAAPAKPQADPALLATLDLSGLQTTNPVSVDPAENTLISPAGTVQVTQAAQLATVSGSSGQLSVITGTGLDNAKTYAPATGHHFEVFTVTAVPGWPKADTAVAGNTAPPAGTVTFVDGATRTDITDKTGLTGFTNSTTTSFVASVADGSKPQLSVGVAGHQQTLSIQTAIRDPDQLTDAYYKANRQSAVNASSPTYTQKFGAYSATYSYALTVSTVTFSPYDPVKGWATAGHMWVEVSAKDDASLPGVDLTPDYSRWTLTADKKAFKPVANSLDGQSSGTATFLVPNTVASVSGSMVTRVVTKPSSDPATTFQGPPAVFTASLG